MKHFFAFCKRNRLFATLLAVELAPGALDGARGLISPTGARVAQPSLAELVAGELRRTA